MRMMRNTAMGRMLPPSTQHLHPEFHPSNHLLHITHVTLHPQTHRKQARERRLKQERHQGKHHSHLDLLLNPLFQSTRHLMMTMTKTTTTTTTQNWTTVILPS